MNKLDICNAALSYIGARNIERMDEASEEARTATLYYENARRELLRRYNWEFATKRKHLALIEGETVEYKYQYRYPSDAIAIRGLIKKFTFTRDNKFKIMSDDEGRYICTNEEEAYVEYTSNVTDTEIFDPLFCECLMWLLAYKMSYRLSRNAEVSNHAMQMYTSYFTEATGGAAREEKPIEPEMSDFVIARFRGGIL